MEFDEFIKQALPPLGYRWRPHRRRGIRRKIQERMRQLHFCSFEDYLYFLQESHPEQEEFKQLLPVTVSRFFRNHEYYDFLKKNIFPDLLQQGNCTLKIWSIGAAAGEEAYSIAMVWDHGFAPQHPDYRLQIVATDIDDNIIERGKTGRYEKSSLREVPAELAGRYFKVIKSHYVIDTQIKQYVDWRHHDILHDLLPTDLQLIFCCYCTFTYFSPALQNKTVVTLAQSLERGGYLVLGRKDMCPERLFDYFQPASDHLNVFKRL